MTKNSEFGILFALVSILFLTVTASGCNRIIGQTAPAAAAEGQVSGERFCSEMMAGLPSQGVVQCQIDGQIVYMSRTPPAYGTALSRSAAEDAVNDELRLQILRLSRLIDALRSENEALRREIAAIKTVLFNCVGF